MKGKKHRAYGGVVDKDPASREVYAGKDSNVVREADERRRGGPVRKRREGGRVEGKIAKMRLDRPGRKTGGRVGADRSPLSEAARTTDRSDTPEEGHCYRDGGKVKGDDHWIAGAIEHKGALHRELGVPMGKDIPAKKLEKAAHSDNPKEAKRARLAETLKKLH